MGRLRNLFVFPDDVWKEAARKLDGEFVKGRWLANSEIKLLHRDYPITLGVRFGTGDDSTQYTKAIPGVSLRPQIKLVLYPKIKGVMGALTSGLLSRTGKGIDLPVLDDDYSVIGDDAELANGLFGHPDFVSALKGVSQNPKVCVGISLSVEKDEEDFCVSVPHVLKDVHQLIAMIRLTKVLLDLLEENGCLE